MEEEIIKNIDKYDNRLNIGLCLEEYNREFICNNPIIPGDDLCQNHTDDQQTIIYEYFDYITDDILFIEKKLTKEYIQGTYFKYVIDIILIEKEIDKNKHSSTNISISKSIKLIEDFIKPDLDIVSLYDEVGYLDEKVEVYKFPNNNKYNHLYNNSILYYKHVYNKDLKRRDVEPYKAYICYKDKNKKMFDTISFVKLFNILNLVYNKDSIIKHFYNITYNRFDITNLLN